MTSLLDQLQSAFPSTYALEREVGRGGMATVFLARDVRYDRKVAVKVLSPELGAVLGVERFLSEIRVTATLQHPNLLPLFDSGEANGLLYYVMPFVEGETLRARLEREKQLSVSETVRLGSAIASALDYAHRNGVIHRDLKPENILLQDGQPLVADFGIALAVSNAGGTRVTQTGLSLGTPQYMSPEQATGDRVIDARSDVYALGAILYECLTGEPPHTGTTAQAIIARLMTEEPRAISATRKNVPAALEDVVMQALNKLPADRFARADDVAKALQAALTATAGSSVRAAVAPGESKTRLVGAVGALVGVVGAAAALWSWARPVDGPDIRFSVQVPDSVRVEPSAGLSIAVSPDGKSFAFLGRTDAQNPSDASLYIHTLSELEPRRIPNTNGAANPVFSPDGKSLVYTQYGTLEFKQVAAAGGAPTTLATAGGAWLGNAWGYGDYFVYANFFGLLRIGRDGRAPGVIASTAGLTPKITAVTNPAILTDGKTVMARVIVNNQGRLAIASVDSGPLTIVDLEIANVIGFQNGILFFGRLDGTVSAVRFDLSSRRVLGVPQTVLDGVSTRTEGGVNAMLAPNGTLVFLRGSEKRQLVVLDARGQVLHQSAAQSYLRAPVWSPDGQRLAVERRPENSSAVVLADVWLYDLTTEQWTRVSDGYAPVWTPNGASLVYRSMQPYNNVLSMVPLDGSAKPRPLATIRDDDPSFSADGRTFVVARQDSGEARSRLVRLSVDSSGAGLDLLPLGENGRDPSVSPDGRWLAYIADDDAGAQLFVKPLRAGGGRVQVSITPDAATPRWGKRSNALYYTSGRTIRRVRLALSGDLPRVIVRDSLMTLPNLSSFDVSPDETQFAFVREAKGDIRPYVFVNWARAVAAKLSSK